ncbi:hypothetical protein QBC46DRAFT_383763, partial [Diplogelasinospora grovesii]
MMQSSSMALLDAFAIAMYLPIVRPFTVRETKKRQAAGFERACWPGSQDNGGYGHKSGYGHPTQDNCFMNRLCLYFEMSI